MGESWPHCIRSVLATSVKILPYRPPGRLIRAKSKTFKTLTFIQLRDKNRNKGTSQIKLLFLENQFENISVLNNSYPHASLKQTKETFHIDFRSGISNNYVLYTLNNREI